MKSKILLGEIRRDVGKNLYDKWVEEAREAYDFGMRNAKRHDLNGSSVSRQSRTAYIGQYVSELYSDFIRSRPAPNQPTASPLEQAVSEA
ncbi:MAG: hypothetical protein AABX12_01135 [Nanoarchaeota archaeon]